MSRLEEYQKRKALRVKLKGKPLIVEAVPSTKVEAILDCHIDEDRIKTFDYQYSLIQPAQVNQGDVQELLNDLKNSFEKQRLESLFFQAQKDVIKSISVPFGLGKVVSAYDKVGGNVDTIHNVRSGVYATDKEQHAYDERGEYNTHAVHSDSRFIQNNREASAARKNGGVADGYSKDRLGRHDKTDHDHIISGKQTHDDPGRVLAGISTEGLANIDSNLTPTKSSVNRSKGKKSPEEFAQYLESTSNERRDRIAALQNTPNLSDKEKSELKKLNSLEAVDASQLRAKGEEARKQQDAILNKEYYLSEKFVKSAVGTSATEGLKMGGQQAFGFMLVEFFGNVFHEIREAFRHGLEGDSLFSDIKIRLHRISEKTAAKWKQALSGGLDGFISGFLSNMVTAVVNAFITTGKRVVRMIREGFLSLLQAVKVVLFPEEGISLNDAAHAGMKILASGSIVLAGVALEEIIEKFVMSVPVLMPIAVPVTAVIVGAISAIGMALATYLIDKLDLFGAIRKEEHAFINEKLNESMKINYQKSLKVVKEIEDLELLPAL